MNADTTQPAHVADPHPVTEHVARLSAVLGAAQCLAGEFGGENADRTADLSTALQCVLKEASTILEVVADMCEEIAA